MKRFFFPLFWKFAIAIIAIVAVFGSINIFLIWSEVYTSLERESEKRARYISHYLASEMVNPLLYEDYILLQQMLQNVRNIDPTVEYAFILDRQNKVLVHTFDGGFPLQLITANVVSKGQAESIRLITPKGAEEKVIRDIAVPILQGKLGTIRVGLLEADIGRDVQKTIKILLTMVGIFLIIGLFGAFAFAKFITNPVHEISRVADNLDLDVLKLRSQPRVKIRGKLFGKWKLPIRATDELDQLAEKFNGMIERLENAYVELQKAHTSLIQSEKMASVGIFSSGIAHEINNPIAGLQNCIRRIMHDPTNIEQNQKYFVMMSEATDKIEKIVRELLEFTRKEQLSFKMINFAEIVEKALLLTAYNLEKSRVSITNELSPNLPEIPGSANHLQQVIVNLLLNAVDAIEENCRKNPDCSRKILITGNIVEENWLSFSVNDSGAGMTDQIREKIFDPFFTTKAAGKGTGLGLSVSFKIVQAHNGKFIVDSIPGAGTTMTILLPLTQKSDKNHEAAT